MDRHLRGMNHEKHERHESDFGQVPLGASSCWSVGCPNPEGIAIIQPRVDRLGDLPWVNMQNPTLYPNGVTSEHRRAYSTLTG
jgi:hypothetical protein